MFEAVMYMNAKCYAYYVMYLCACKIGYACMHMCVCVCVCAGVSDSAL